MKFVAYIPGYGSFTFDAETRTLAEQMANTKRQWEGARSCCVWRAPALTEYDKLTKEIAGIWESGRGVPIEKIKSRALARAKLGDIQQ